MVLVHIGMHIAIRTEGNTELRWEYHQLVESLQTHEFNEAKYCPSNQITN